MAIDYSTILKNFAAKKIIQEELDAYHSWTLNHFRRKDYITNPCLSFNLDLDIDELYFRFKDSNSQGSFSRFFLYAIAKSMVSIKELRYRYLGESWYELGKVPIMLPVRTNDGRRFSRVLLSLAPETTYGEFEQEYQKQYRGIFENPETPITTEEGVFLCSVFIGNLTQLQFNSLNIHQFVHHTGRQMVYLGKRFQKEGRMHVPFHITMDHANADPVVLEKIFENIFSMDSK